MLKSAVPSVGKLALYIFVDIVRNVMNERYKVFCGVLSIRLSSPLKWARLVLL